MERCFSTKRGIEKSFFFKEVRFLFLPLKEMRVFLYQTGVLNLSINRKGKTVFKLPLIGFENTKVKPKGKRKNYYILSGAEIPIKWNISLNAVLIAFSSARRAFISSSSSTITL